MKAIHHYFIYYSFVLALCLGISHTIQAACEDIQAGQPQPSKSPICSLSEMMKKPSGKETNTNDYAFLITNSQTLNENGDPVIIGVSEDGIFDFIDHPAGTYCFYGIAYNQADLDEVADFINNSPLNAALTPSPDYLPLPIPFPLEMFVEVMEDLVSMLTIPSFIDMMGLLESFNLEVCYAIVEEPHCVEREKIGCCEASLSSEQQIYIGENATLVANMIDGTPPYTYEWSTGSISEQSDSTSLIVSPSATTTYELTISDAGGCTANNTVTVFAYEKGQPIPPLQSDFCQFSPAATNIPSPEATGKTDYTFIITDSQNVDENGDPVMIGLSDDGVFDFTDYLIGVYCFHGFAYNQADLDQMAQFLNTNVILLPTVGMPPDLLPLPMPLPLAEFFDIAKQVTGGALTIETILPALDLLADLDIIIDYQLAEPYCLSKIGQSINLGGDQQICVGQAITLVGNISEDVKIAWYANDSLIVCEGTEIEVMPEETTVYRLEIVEENGCKLVDEITVTVDCLAAVWAGDANNDSIVNHHDILPIALAYEQTGYQRPNASSEWQPEYCQEWEQSINQLTNDKHADCNGDGQIDRTDISLVELNYGKKIGEVNNIVWQSNDGVPLYCNLPEEINSGESSKIGIYLGTENIEATDIYGIAFSVLIKPTDSLNILQPKIDYENSWIGKEVDNRLTFDHQLNAYQWDIAIARTDRATQTGSGLLCEVDCIMEVGSILKSGTTSMLKIVPFAITFESVRLLNKEQEVVSVNVMPSSSSVVLDENATNTLTPLSKEFFVNISPNPAKNKLQIKANLPSKSATYTLNLLNVTGQKMIEQQLTTTQLRQHQIDISQLKTGIYWLQINDEQEFWMKKVMIMD